MRRWGAMTGLCGRGSPAQSDFTRGPKTSVNLASTGRVKARYANSNGAEKLVSVLDPLAQKSLLHLQLGMEPTVRIELTTRALRKRCSTN